MKKIYKGGYNAPSINGLKPVNCGAHFVGNNGYTYEVMSEEFSTHPTNIVSLYIKDKGRKIELSIWLKNPNDYDNAVFGVAFYKTFSDTMSYRFSNYIAKKYSKYKSYLIEAHKEIFNGEVGKHLVNL